MRNWFRTRRPTVADAGQVLVISALLFPVVIGFTGIALDVGILMARRTDRQRTADAAALAGAQYMVYNSMDAVGGKQAACEYAKKNGYGDGTCIDSEVEVFIPPTSGPNKGKSGYVEVKIRRTDPTFFIRLLGIDESTVSARAVGGSVPRLRNYALIVLDPTQCDAFTTSSNITIDGGGAIVDSDGSTGGSCSGRSAIQNGGSIVTANACKDKSGNTIDCTLDYNSEGSWQFSSNSQASPAPTRAPYFPDPLSCGPPPAGSQAHVEDDYCPRPVPCRTVEGTDPVGCVPWSSTSAGSVAKAFNPTITQLSGSGDVVLEPGVYFGGLRISSTSLTVRFKPGIYVLAGSDHNGNGGGFDYQSGNLCGPGEAGTCPVATGVTFFNTRNPYAKQESNWPCNGMSITGSGLLKFAAPTVRHTTPLTGYKNMLFWQDDSCTALFKFAGSGSGPWSATGIMYFPEATMQVTGGGNFGSVQIIVDKFIQGGSQNIDIKFTRFIDTDVEWYKLVE